MAPPWSSGSVLDHRSLPSGFESRSGHTWMFCRPWLRLITFGGRSAHSAYHVHKSGRKTATINIKGCPRLIRLFISARVHFGSLIRVRIEVYIMRFIYLLTGWRADWLTDSHTDRLSFSMTTRSTAIGQLTVRWQMLANWSELNVTTRCTLYDDIFPSTNQTYGRPSRTPPSVPTVQVTHRKHRRPSSWFAIADVRRPERNIAAYKISAEGW